MNFFRVFPLPTPPHHFSNGPSLTITHTRCLFYVFLSTDSLNGDNNNKADPCSLTGDAIVCCGGFEGRFNLETVEVFSLTTNTWIDLPPLPIACNSMAGGAYGKAIVVAGGIDKKTSLDNVSLFDWQKQAWEELSPLHSARAYCCGAMDRSRARFLITGGLNGGELDSTESLDINTGKWTMLPAMPTARSKCGGAMLGADFFAVVSFNAFKMKPAVATLPGNVLFCLKVFL